MSLRDRPQKRYKCSCGRTFAHEISLKRHKFVAGCEDLAEGEADSAEEAPVQDETQPAAGVDGEATTPVAAAPGRHFGEDHFQQMFQLAQERMDGAVRGKNPAVPFLELLDQGLNLFCEFLLWLAELAGAALTGTARAFGACVPMAVHVVQKAVVVALFLFLALVCVRGVQAARADAAPAGSPLIAPAEAATYPRRVAQAPSRPPVPAAAVSAPAQTVATFYAELERGSYPGAYSRLSPAWQAELPYRRFASGYRGTSRMDCRVLRTWNLGAGRAQVDFVLEAHENGVPVTYRGHHLLVATSGGWTLDGGNLAR
ncbi:MAG: hypothetical protein HY319_05865 [Armatimonadetes bacterium]|nr:hypothetical protein [Armatimonadota bacterium]